jgi:signal transduction histidine kinase
VFGFRDVSLSQNDRIGASELSGKPAVKSARASQNQQAPRRPIQTWLNWLVIASVLPAIAVTTFIIIRSFNQERANLERDLVGTARALAQAVDAEFDGVRSALLILAWSPHLESGDLARFYEDAQQVIRATKGDNIVLTDADGQPIFNTLQPFGAPLLREDTHNRTHKLSEDGHPVVSDLVTDSDSQKPVFRIEVPVISNGKPLYRLAMGIRPGRLNEILLRQKMPADWATAIVDNSGTIVARTIGGDQVVGKEVSPGLKRAIAAAAEGAFEGVSREGVAVLSSFSRSASSGWTVAIGIPKESLSEFFWRALWENVVAAYLLLVIGVLLARRIGTRIAHAIDALRVPAATLGLSDNPVVPAVDIQEVHELGQSLLAAHQLIEQRTTERNALRHRIMRAQEEERLRLARDLHDQTGQSVSAAIMDLKAIEPLVEEKGRERVRVMGKQLEGLGHMLHRIAWELRPASIDELGLTHALENYIEEWSSKNKITADFHCADTKLDERSDEIRTTIYRIAQESLTNIAKHAVGATHVGVVISTSDDTLHLTIEDNGRGFDPTILSSRLGLAGMHERMSLVGGKLEVESSPGTGATIFARIPLGKRRAAA